MERIVPSKSTRIKKNRQPPSPYRSIRGIYGLDYILSRPVWQAVLLNFFKE